MPRPEYPRPQLRRERWLNLNGTWRFAIDHDDVGKAAGWNNSSSTELDLGNGPIGDSILVPFCPEARLSGVGDAGYHDVVWYGRTFTQLPHTIGERVLMHFGAVDYRAEVWINGELATRHEGGHTPFTADITDLLLPTMNTVVVRAQDPGSDPTIPRGKQDWEEVPSHIFYSRTTGIWQTVWLEVVADMHVEELRLTPDLESATVAVDMKIAGWRPGARVTFTATIDGGVAGVLSVRPDAGDLTATLHLGRTPLRLWSPDDPALYDLEVEILDSADETRDVVDAYFGVRGLQVVGDRLRLNGEPLFLRMVLDQGYWPDGLLTAPTDEALRRDIEVAMEMGFNGARKHQKAEDPRWLYWADRLGFLVWEEMPNAHDFSPDAASRTVREWTDIVSRDYNHPCIVAWVPINESNGCRRLGVDRRTPTGAFESQFAFDLYRMTRSIDRTRIALSNDGWEHTVSDLCTIHDYGDEEILRQRVSTLDALLMTAPSTRAVFAGGNSYGGQPILVTEFGGIFYPDQVEGFAYGAANTIEEFIRTFAALTAALIASPFLAGFCYTQLTDIEHERNGLLTADRIPKVPPEAIRAILSGAWTFASTAKAE